MSLIGVAQLLRLIVGKKMRESVCVCVCVRERERERERETQVSLF